MPSDGQSLCVDRMSFFPPENTSFFSGKRIECILFLKTNIPSRQDIKIRNDWSVGGLFNLKTIHI